MNNLEKEIVNKYRLIFPNDTLKVISEKTNIQITRVFRIMNGKPMKVKEFEAFDRIINAKCGSNKQSTEIERLTKLAMTTLSIKDIESIISLIERKLLNTDMKRSPLHNGHESKIA